jgi:hypothetical protein
MMPLKLIERVLPWLVGSLTEDEARKFLENMQLAGSTSNSSIVASRKIIKAKTSFTFPDVLAFLPSLNYLQCHQFIRIFC